MTRHELLEERLTRTIIGAFFEVYNYFGLGLFESLYVNALATELRSRGVFVRREQWTSVTYKGEQIGLQRLDMVVADRIVVEAKATDRLAPIATRQLLTYRRASNLQLGLLLHFGPDPRFFRVVNSHEGSARR